MKTYLVVEGKSDTILMQPLIAAAGLEDVEIVDGGGKSSAMSLGKSIAISRLLPVAVLVDADTTDENALQSQETIFKDLQRYGPKDVNCRLFLAVPTLEDELFPKPNDFSRIYNITLSPEQRVRFREDRKRIIKSFYSVSNALDSTIRHGLMDTKAAQSGWGIPLLSELFDFLRTGRISTKKGKARSHRTNSRKPSRE